MRFWTIVVLFFAFASCIEEIEFVAPGQIGILVVDGNLTTSGDSNLIQLSRTDKLGQQVFPPVQATTVTLRDDEGKTEPYLALGNGKYWLKGNILKPKIGGTYHLEIELENGRKYQSQAERILPAPEIDSLSFETAIENIVVDETKELSRTVVDFFVHGHISTPPDKTYLQWKVEQVSAVSELTCSPFLAAKTCYIYRQSNPNQLFLLDGTLLRPNADYKELISKQVLDYSYGQLTSYYVSQRSISRDAYIYLDQVERIVNEVGSIFDAPPAAIPGNIFSLDDPTEKVLGYFSAYDEKKALLFIESNDLGERRKLPLCGIPGFPPDPLHQACCNCLLLDNSSTLRPSYWP